MARRVVPPRELQHAPTEEGKKAARQKPDAGRVSRRRTRPRPRRGRGRPRRAARAPRQQRRTPSATRSRPRRSRRSAQTCDGTRTSKETRLSSQGKRRARAASNRFRVERENAVPFLGSFLVPFPAFLQGCSRFVCTSRGARAACDRSAHSLRNVSLSRRGISMKILVRTLYTRSAEHLQRCSAQTFRTNKQIGLSIAGILAIVSRGSAHYTTTDRANGPRKPMCSPGHSEQQTGCSPHGLLFGANRRRREIIYLGEPCPFFSYFHPFLPLSCFLGSPKWHPGPRLPKYGLRPPSNIWQRRARPSAQSALFFCDRRICTSLLPRRMSCRDERSARAARSVSGNPALVERGPGSAASEEASLW